MSATPDMPTFAATIVDTRGRRKTSVWEVGSETELRQRLQAASLWPVRIRTVQPSKRRSRLRLPTRDFIALLNQLELQLRAGVMANVALEQLLQDSPKGKTRDLLAHIHQEVSRGSPIHTACRYFTRQFPPHVAAIIAAGEASATLPESLGALASHLTGADDLRKTAGRALIYPAVVCAASGILVVFLLGGVVPRFAEILSSMRVALPWPTRVLIASSGLVEAHWGVLLIGSGLALVAGVFLTRSPRCRYARDAAMLRLPLLGETIRCVATARFASHCRLLHEAGIPLLDALTSGAELTGNAVLSSRLLVAREGAAVGQPLYAALPRDGAFPSFVAPALKAGETTGQLGAALHHVEAYAAARARELTATALALLEPAILIFLAVVVGGIVLSFMLPLLALMTGVNAR